MVMKKKNKRGWIKVLEAFVSIIMLIGLLAVIVQTQGTFSNKEAFMNKADKIIEDIRINDSLRDAVISQGNLPIYSNEAGFSNTLSNYLDSIDTNLMNCTIGICSTQSPCNLQEDYEGEVYSKESLIMSTDSTYSPRKLKIFCTKE